MRDDRICWVGLAWRLKFSRVYIYFLTEGNWRIVGLGIGIHIWGRHWTHEFSWVYVQSDCRKLWRYEVLGLYHLVIKRGSWGFIKLVYFAVVRLIQSVRRYKVFSWNHYWRSLRFYLRQINLILFPITRLSCSVIYWITLAASN